ncbi:MAG: tetratricopeptide repeat protein [Cyclobacteriaceae bacterium]
MSNRPAKLILLLILLQFGCSESDMPAVRNNYEDLMAFELQYKAAKNAMHESPQEATYLLNEARQTATNSGNQENVAKTWYLEGYINDLHNRPGDAYKAFLESEVAYDALNDSVWVEKSLRYQAAILLRLPDTERAIKTLDRADAYAGSKQAGYRQQYLRGVAAYHDSEYEEATAIFDGVSKSCRAAGDQEYLAQVLNYQGLISLKHRDYEKAAADFYKSANTNSHDASRRVVAYNNLGLLLENKGNLDSAGYYYKKAIEIPVETGGIRHHMVAALNLGQLYLIKKDYAAAEEVVLKSLSVNTHLQDAIQLETAYGILIRAYENTGKMNEARKLWKQLELVKNERNDLLRKQDKLEVELAEMSMQQRIDKKEKKLAHIPWLPYLQLLSTAIVLVAGTFVTIQFFRQRRAIRQFKAHFKRNPAGRNDTTGSVQKKDLTSAAR